MTVNGRIELDGMSGTRGYAHPFGIANVDFRMERRARNKALQAHDIGELVKLNAGAPPASSHSSTGFLTLVRQLTANRARLRTEVQ